MFRFTIRDVLWLTVLVALGVAWLIEQWRSEQQHTAIRTLENEAQVSRMAITSLHQDIERIEKDLPPHGLRLVWSNDLRPSVQKLVPPNP